MQRKIIAKKLAKFFLRYNRGSGLVSFLTSMVKDVVYYGILMDLAYRYLHWTFPVWVIPVLVILAVFIYYIIGAIDEKVGFWKFQNDYSTKELTPFFEEMSQDIKNIKEKLKLK